MPDVDDGSKRFLDRRIHWLDPIWTFRGAKRVMAGAPVSAQASTIGLAVGIALVVMPLYDWPLDVGGILFAACGLALAGLCLYVIVRSGRVAAEQDKTRVYTPDGDLAP